VPTLPELGLTKRESAEGQLMAELRAAWEHDRAPESREEANAARSEKLRGSQNASKENSGTTE
jgi:hypothetical protein